jgi:hypothetical protein
MKTRKNKPAGWKKVIFLVIAFLVIISMIGGQFLFLFSPAVP